MGSQNSRDKIQGWNPSVTRGKRGDRMRNQEGRVRKQNTQGQCGKRWNSHIMKKIAGLSSIMSRIRTWPCWCLDPYCPVSCWPTVGIWLMDDSVTIYGRDPWISLSCNTHGSQHLSNKGLEERLVGRQESPAPQLCMLEEGKGSRMRVILTLSITVWKDSRVKLHSALRQEKRGQNDSCGKLSLKQDQAILDILHPYC